MLTEKDKMLSGVPYDAFDPELLSARIRARELTRQLNANTNDEDTLEVAKQLFGAVGEGTYITPPFHCDYGSNIYWGDRSYANFNCVILDCATVTIGKNVLLAPNVNIYTAAHPVNTKERISGIEFALPVTIEDNVWIGGNVTINPGITIGKNSVIGSGSVVTKDIPANVVAAGNPCRVLRPLSEDEKL